MPTLTLITREFPPVIYGGVGNTARILFNYYSKIKSLKVNVITYNHSMKEKKTNIDQKGNIIIYKIKGPYWFERFVSFFYKPLLLFSFYVGLYSLFNRKIIKESDIIHSLNIRDIPFLFKQKKPLVLNISDIYSFLVPFNPFKYPFNEKRKFLKYLNHMWFRLIDSISIKRANILLCTCNYSKDFVENKFKKARGITYLVHKGIDIPFSQKKVKKETDVMFIGSRFEIKGAKEVLFAINILKKKYQNIKCLMIGRYSKFDFNYEKFIKDNNLQGNVTILTNLSHEKIIDYLKKARIFVNPTHLEIIAQTATEAMAVKVPVISSDVGGMTEAVEHNKTGFIIKANDYEALAKYIDFLLSNPKRAEELGKNGFKKVKVEFTDQEMVKNYIKIYNKFLSEEKKIEIPKDL